MEISNFISGTIWVAILLISIGLTTGRIENNFTSWFFFAFFCVVGLFKWAIGRSDARRKKC